MRGVGRECASHPYPPGVGVRGTVIRTGIESNNEPIERNTLGLPTLQMSKLRKKEQNHWLRACKGVVRPQCENRQLSPGSGLLTN